VDDPLATDRLPQARGAAWMIDKGIGRLANTIGTRYLSFQNPRVVSPPGMVGHHRRRNIIVATPMRSGTHVLIDLILNNLPDYRTRPLYVDLDQLVKRSRSAPGLYGTLGNDSGHVIKTHFPIAVDPNPAEMARVAALTQKAFVITVRRDEDAILRSLRRMNSDRASSASFDDRVQQDIGAFWAMWADRADLEIAFDDLFSSDAISLVLDRIATATSVRRARRLTPPMDATQRWRIYVAKATTRLLGRRAPRIDTTIYTLQ
jgi:hypothetical protein